MAAVIGALRVDLGLNSAEFQAGLKKAQAGLGNFVKTAGVGLAAVAAAGVAAGAALGVAVKGAIDNADQMGEMAEKAGVSVEALTSYGYAAKMSGSDTETLAASLRKLSTNMLAVAQGSTGPVATAFQALGISVQNADGSLKASDQVLLSVAEKFALMENGATKTALAVQLFGKSGAELVPFLSRGRDGLAALTAEADRLGVTISTGTANAAGEFNDTLDRLRATFDGVINKIMAGALPSLNQLGAKLADPSFAAAAQALAQGVVGAINLIVDAVSAAGEKLTELGNLLNWMATHDWTTGQLDPDKVDARRRGAMAELAGQLGRGESEAPSADFMTSIFGATTPEIAASAATVATAFEPVITNTKAASSAASELKAVMAEGQAVFTATRTPAEAYAIEVERLNRLLQQGAIDQDTYNRAITSAQDTFRQAEQAGSEYSSTLASGFANIFSSAMEGADAARSAVDNLLKSLTNMALNKGFEALLGGLFGGGFGGFKIPGFANGTNFAPGGLAVVGERGPELVNLPRGSQVIPNSSLRSSGETLVRVELGADLEGRILTQSAGQAVQIVQASEPGTVQKSAAASGKALAGGDYRRGMATYGLQQQAKRR